MDGSSVGSGFVILLALYSTARVEQSGLLVEPHSPQAPTKDVPVGTQFEPLRIEDYQRQRTSEIKVRRRSIRLNLVGTIRGSVEGGEIGRKTSTNTACINRSKSAEIEHADSLRFGRTANSPEQDEGTGWV